MLAGLLSTRASSQGQSCCWQRCRCRSCYGRLCCCWRRCCCSRCGCDMYAWEMLASSRRICCCYCCCCCDGCCSCCCCSCCSALWGQLGPARFGRVPGEPGGPPGGGPGGPGGPPGLQAGRSQVVSWWDLRPSYRMDRCSTRLVPACGVDGKGSLPAVELRWPRCGRQQEVMRYGLVNRQVRPRRHCVVTCSGRAVSVALSRVG